MKFIFSHSILAAVITTFATADDTGRPHSHGGSHSHSEEEAGDHGDQSGHHATIIAPTDPADLWAHINAYTKVVIDSAHAGDMDTLHKEQLNLETLVGELDHISDVVVDDKKARVEGMLNNAKRALSQLHQATDSNDQAGIKKSVKGLDGVIKLLKSQYPRELTGGMAEVKDDLGPHEGMLAEIKNTSGEVKGHIELKLHDDKGDLELWIAKDAGITQPLDLAATETIQVSFTDAEKDSVTLAIRNPDKNEDEDGNATMRGGKTNYFIFPGETGASAEWLQGREFKSIVTVTFGDEAAKMATDAFLLIPHGHPGHQH